MTEQNIYLICRPCDDFFYPGHPTGVAYNTREAANNHLVDNRLIDEDFPESSYYVQKVILYSN